MKYDRNKVTYPIGLAGTNVDSTRKYSGDDKREVMYFKSYIENNTGGLKDYLIEKYDIEPGVNLVEYRNRLNDKTKAEFNWVSDNTKRKPKTQWLDIELVFDNGLVVRVDVERTSLKHPTFTKDGKEIFNCFSRKMKYLQKDPENFLYASFNYQDRLSIVSGDYLVDLEDVYKEFKWGMDYAREVPVERVKRFYV